MHQYAEATNATFEPVGKAEDWKDGEAKEVKVHKKPMTVARIGEKFFAINSICPHMGGPLSCGKIHSGIMIQCPWHDWSFDLETGECLNGHSVERYHVKVEEGRVLVGWIKK